MESEILDLFEDCGYSAINTEETLRNAVEGAQGGPHNLAYTHLIGWITDELSALCQLEEKVTPTSSPDDHATFVMELSSFIKELGCPYKKITEGSVSQRFASEENRLLVISYLLRELQAARMISSEQSDGEMKVELEESEPAKDLKTLLVALAFSKPPSNITPKQLFVKVKEKKHTVLPMHQRPIALNLVFKVVCAAFDMQLAEVISKCPKSLIGQPLLSLALTDGQWHLLCLMQKEIHSEYRLRRQMLIKRLDVTIQSFQWSDKAKERENELSQSFRKIRNLMSEEPSVTLSHLLAVREDLAILEKTSSSSVRKNTQTKLNKVLIGKVPDRGGRANELEPPPPEMPSWTQRSAGAGGGRGAGNFSSDRIQGGGWSHGHNNHGGGTGFSYHRGGGGYRGRGRGGRGGRY